MFYHKIGNDFHINAHQNICLQKMFLKRLQALQILHIFSTFSKFLFKRSFSKMFLKGFDKSSSYSNCKFLYFSMIQLRAMTNHEIKRKEIGKSRLYFAGRDRRLPRVGLFSRINKQIFKANRTPRIHASTTNTHYPKILVKICSFHSLSKTRFWGTF